MASKVHKNMEGKGKGKGKGKWKGKEGMGTEGKGKEGKGTEGKGKTSLLFAPTPHWTTVQLPALPSTSPTKRKTLSDSQITGLQKRAYECLAAENDAFAAASGASSGSGAPVGTLSASDARFLSTILSSGTLSDRISALTLLLQSSPLHNMKALDTLKGMAAKKGREESGRATRALLDWLIGGGGLGNRKLRYFRDQPLLASNAEAVSASPAHLVFFAFEDHMKKWYFEFLRLLEVHSHDPLPFVRSQGIAHVFQLLKEKSEQEQNLLRLLVNKLGDGDRSIASKASYHLLQLLQVHPAMKTIVVREVASIVLRPPTSTTAQLQASASQYTSAMAAKPEGTHIKFDNVDDGKAAKKAAPKTGSSAAGASKHNHHATYYGVLTLNQTTLTRKDQEVANKLIDVYFELFENVLKERGEGARDEKRGIGADGAEGGAEGSEEEGGKGAGGKKDKGRWRDGKKAKGKGKASLPEKNRQLSDAEAKIMAAILTGVNRALPFAKVEADAFDARLVTLFRITHSGTFNVSIQALTLIYTLVSSNTLASASITARFYRTLYESLIDSRLANTSKQAMYLNLLFKAIKADTDPRRVRAFVKRLLQVMSGMDPPFVCGAFYLLGQLFSSIPGLRGMLTDPEEEDEEHFGDVHDSEEEQEEASHAGRDAEAEQGRDRRGKYDGRKRDPQYSNAQNTCLWELLPFLHHFHPSVSLHARQLLAGEIVTTTPDLDLNTLAHFLDRFVYRNPKKKPVVKGASIMQPAAAGQDRSGMLISQAAGFARGEMSVNDEKFWRLNATEVPVDQLFFHKFFTQKVERQKAMAQKVGKRKGAHDAEDKSDMDDEEEEGQDVSEGDEGEKEVWEAMKRSFPGAEGGVSDVSEGDSSDDSDDAKEHDYGTDSDDEAIKKAIEGGADEDEDGWSGLESAEGEEGDEIDGMESDGEEDRAIGREEGEEEEEVQSDEAPGVAYDPQDMSDDEGEDFFAEDEDDLMPFTEPIAIGSEDEEGESDGQAKKKTGKRSAPSSDEEAATPQTKRDRLREARKKERKARKKAKREAPVFASAEDYAHLLGDDEDEDGA